MKQILFSLFFIALLVPVSAAGKKFEFEFTERVRYINWNNAIDLEGEFNDRFSFTRHRTSVSFRFRPAEKLSFNVKLTNENRIYFRPENRDFNIHEIFFDQLNIQFKKLFGLPLTLTIGRQNIVLGEGFLVLDANPLDGSRSIYFNAVRGDYHFNKFHKLTAFYAYQEENDNYLPIINSKDQMMIEQPEEGLGLYYSGLFSGKRLEVYFIRKNIKSNDSNSISHGINTVGLRTVLPIRKRLSLTAEGAFQSGYIRSLYSYDQKRRAFGGYFHLDYRLNDNKLSPVLTLGGFYLSGDKLSTDNYEAWDPLFSRWPKWSESYIYTMIKEHSVAYWSNIYSLYSRLKFRISPKIGLDLALYKLYAAQYSNSQGTFLSGTGTDRGRLLTSKLNMKFNKCLSGHVVYETFKPGDFYLDDASGYYWLRFELFFKWNNR